MPAPVFNPTLAGSAPNQIASWPEFLAQVQMAINEIWDGKADASVFLDALRTSTITLTNVRGTGDAIIADVSGPFPTAEIATPPIGSEFRWQAVATNGSADPSLTVGGVLLNLISANGGAVPAGAIRFNEWQRAVRTAAGAARLLTPEVDRSALMLETAARQLVAASATEAEASLGRDLAAAGQWVRPLGQGDDEAPGPHTAIIGPDGWSAGWDAQGNPIFKYYPILGLGDDEPTGQDLTIVSEDGRIVDVRGGGGGGGNSPIIPDNPSYDLAPASVVRPVGTLYGHYDALMAEFPGYITRVSLGQDGLGNHIYAYQLRPTPNRVRNWTAAQINLPHIVICGGIHGWEYEAHKGVLNFIQTLCRRWQYFPEYEAMRFGLNLTVIPAQNPSGITGGSRVNHNGVDLNRNFNVEWADATGEKGATPASELETQIMQGVVDLYPDCIGLIDSHTHSEDWFFWLGTRTPEALGLATQAISRAIGWFKKNVNDPGEAFPLGEISQNGPGTGAAYHQTVKGKPVILVEVSGKVDDRAYGASGFSERNKSLANERLLMEAIYSMFQREQERRRVNQLTGE